METGPTRVERRLTQRFEFTLPVSVRLAGSQQEGSGFTQNLSARGTLFFTEFRLAEGDAVELTLAMPSEITLTETARVRCRGRVMRVIPSAVGQAQGVAVHIDSYEFLPEAEARGSGAYARVSPLHEHDGEREPAAVSAHGFHPRSLAQT